MFYFLGFRKGENKEDIIVELQSNSADDMNNNIANLTNWIENWKIFTSQKILQLLRTSLIYKSPYNSKPEMERKLLKLELCPVCKSRKCLYELV